MTRKKARPPVPGVKAESVLYRAEGRKRPTLPPSLSLIICLLVTEEDMVKEEEVKAKKACSTSLLPAAWEEAGPGGWRRSLP